MKIVEVVVAVVLVRRCLKCIGGRWSPCALEVVEALAPGKLGVI